MDNSTTVQLILGVSGLLALVVLVKSLADYFVSSGDLKKAKLAVESALENAKARRESEPKDALAQMTQNTAELREYYTISKSQAQSSFAAALVACILGFAIYAVGILITYVEENRVIEYTTIGGSMVEVIAGLFFWLYSKASEQMGTYHTSLIETQRQLSAIQLSDKMDETNRNKAYAYIITKLMDKSQAAQLETQAQTTTEQPASTTETKA